MRNVIKIIKLLATKHAKRNRNMTFWPGIKKISHNDDDVEQPVKHKQALHVQTFGPNNKKNEQSWQSKLRKTNKHCICTSNKSMSITCLQWLLPLLWYKPKLAATCPNFNLECKTHDKIYTTCFEKKTDLPRKAITQTAGLYCLFIAGFLFMTSALENQLIHKLFPNSILIIAFINLTTS